jgi:hypothetical protein
MNRSQLEHIIRAASQISDDREIVVIGSQAIHAQNTRLPPIVFQSMEADVYPATTLNAPMTSMALLASFPTFTKPLAITRKAFPRELRFFRLVGNADLSA